MYKLKSEKYLEPNDLTRLKERKEMLDIAFSCAINRIERQRAIAGLIEVSKQINRLLERR